MIVCAICVTYVTDDDSRGWDVFGRRTFPYGGVFAWGGKYFFKRMKIFFQAFEKFSKREKAALAQQGKADAEEVCALKKDAIMTLCVGRAST